MGESWHRERQTRVTGLLIEKQVCFRGMCFLGDKVLRKAHPQSLNTDDIKGFDSASESDNLKVMIKPNWRLRYEKIIGYFSGFYVYRFACNSHCWR